MEDQTAEASQEREIEQVEGSDENMDTLYMFDNLCYGVLTTLNFVQSAVDELMSLKDELLNQGLPPVVLSRLTLCTAKVFRSVSDCWMPASELTRLVQLYSMPWEEKNRAFRKLYENFESKKRQLNIAIRRLQLLESQCQWLEQENRRKTLENMFVKMMSAKIGKNGWRFLTAWFNKKAEEGPISLLRFVRQMAKAMDSDDEEDDESEDFGVLEQLIPREPLRITSHETYESEEIKSEMSHYGEQKTTEFRKDMDTKRRRKTRTSLSQLHDIKPQRRSVDQRPVMLDSQTWTHEPEFDQYLCVRVFRPEGLGQQDLYCRVHFNTQTCEIEFKNSTVTQESSGPRPATRTLKGRGLIGSRNVSADNLEAQATQQPRYEDCILHASEGILSGISSTPVQLTFEIFGGGSDCLLARAMADVDDLKTMDMPTVMIPPNRGDEDPLEVLFTHIRKSSTTSSSLTCVPEKIVPHIDFLSNRLQSAEPTTFPVYAGAESSEICGFIQLVCLWGKQERLRMLNRVTESETMREIVQDLTGLDLAVFLRDETCRETRDQATSPRNSDAQETLPPDCISRVEYEKVLRGHVAEIQLLRDEYEMRMLEMENSLHEMEETQTDLQRLIQASAESSSNSISEFSRSRSGHPTDLRSMSKPDFSSGEYVPQPPKEGKSPRRLITTSGTRLSKSASNLGANVPENFYERLKHFESMSLKHRQELAEKTKQDEREAIVKRLSAMYKPNTESSDTTQEVSLPAVFMPTKTRDFSMYNPKALRFLSGTDAHGLRQSLFSSELDLPPITNPITPVINLYQVGQKFQPGASSIGNQVSHTFNQTTNPTTTSTPTDSVLLLASETVQKQ